MRVRELLVHRLLSGPFRVYMGWLLGMGSYNNWIRYITFWGTQHNMAVYCSRMTNRDELKGYDLFLCFTMSCGINS